MDGLLELDRWLLLKINQDWTHPLLDLFFPIITDLHKTQVFIWLILPLFVGLIAFLRRRQIWEILLTLMIGAGLADLFCARVLKPLVERPRPFVGGEDVLVRSPIFGHYGFPSNHAANIFCVAIIMSHYFPKARWYLLAMAFVVAYSRSYVGVHYPSDWIAGAIIGLSIGLLVLKVAARIRHSRRSSHE